jgi:hypothetical protein
MTRTLTVERMKIIAIIHLLRVETEGLVLSATKMWESRTTDADTCLITGHHIRSDWAPPTDKPLGGPFMALLILDHTLMIHRRSFRRHNRAQ